MVSLMCAVIGQQYAASSNEQVDMMISNETEYRAWNSKWNGLRVKQAPGNDTSQTQGAFASINLLGPREPAQSGAVAGWDKFTYVQIKVAFVTDKSQQGGSSLTPIVLPRTYLSFYDFDSGLSGLREAMQTDPVVKEVVLAHVSEIGTFPSLLEYMAEENTTRADMASFFTAAGLEDVESWTGQGTSKLYAGTTYGIGKDNPIESYTLTQEQAARTVMLRIEGVSEFRVRYALSPCCTTGRNFMFAGYSNLVRPICQETSPLQSPPPSLSPSLQPPSLSSPSLLPPSPDVAAPSRPPEALSPVLAGSTPSSALTDEAAGVSSGRDTDDGSGGGGVATGIGAAIGISFGCAVALVVGKKKGMLPASASTASPMGAKAEARSYSFPRMETTTAVSVASSDVGVNLSSQ